MNVKRPFHGYPGGLRNTSVEHVCGELYWVTVTDVHTVVLTSAPILKTRRVAPSVDFISEGN